EAAGIPEPVSVNGVMQAPIEGTSMLYSFGDADAEERHDLQYFEMVCNRGIYHKGWTAVTRHGLPWHVTGTAGRLAEDVWELYDTDSDWSQAHDLAAQMPDKLEELKRLFEIEAAKYNVLPLDDRKAERANPELAGRPTPVAGTTQLLYGGMHRLQENAVINIKNHSHSVTAEIEVPEAGAQGVIIAQGGDFGGWALYAHQGRLRYAYNFVGVQRSYIGSDKELPAGTHQARMEFTYDGGGIGKGGTVSLYVDGDKVGDGRVERTHKFFYSMDETADIGSDAGAPVSEDYGPGDNDFSGKVNWVQIDVDAAAKDVDHLIAGEERFHLAMAKQ
ncbi:MAG TPA: arylsulfatase, partial [Actinomycetes bacterium]